MSRAEIRWNAADLWDQQLEHIANKDGSKERLKNMQLKVAHAVQIETSLPVAHYPLRPTLLQRSLYDELGEVLPKIASMVLRLSFHLSSNNPNGLNEALGEAPANIESYLSSSAFLHGLADSELRPDFLLHKGRPKILELNFGPLAGGMLEVAEQSRIYLSHDLGQTVALARGLYCDSPVSNRALLLKEIADRAGLRHPNIAVLLRKGDEQSQTARLFASRLASQGVPVDLVPVDDLEEQNSMARYQGKFYDIVIVGFTEDYELSTAPGTLSAYRSVCRKGKTIVVGGEWVFSLGHKALLAHLSENASKDGCLSEEESDLVNRYIPWSRILKSPLITFKGEQLDLSLGEHKDRFVIKKSASVAGNGVFVGRNTSLDVWNAKIKEAIRAGNYIVQEFLESDRVTLPFFNEEKSSLEFRVCNPVHSIYLMGRRKSGILTRFSTDLSTDVIGIRTGGLIPSLIEPNDVLSDRTRP